MRKIALTLTVTFLVLLDAIGQNRPYPQQQNWDNCIKPTNTTQNQMNSDVSSYYDYWKTKYLKVAVTGGYYIQGEATGGGVGDKGTSEGQGYGMIITVLMAGYDNNAKAYFDGLYNFFDNHRSSINNELMGWLVDANESGSGNHDSAADGDMDIAYALLLAHYQWGSSGTINYLQEAKDMINNGVKVSDMHATSKRVMLGDWDNNQYTTRPSDWMTSHMHAYYDATQDVFWNQASDMVYQMMGTISSNQAAVTGLMPDFVVGAVAEPSAPNFLESVNDGDFYYNAARFTWRISMDYGHYGTSSSKTQMNKILSWLKPLTSNNPSNIRAGYKLNGTNITGNDYQDATFISPMVVASTVDATHQNYLNAGWSLIKNMKSSYFPDNINLLCMLYISGNWWKPESSSGGCATILDLGSSQNLCNPATVVLNTQLNPLDYTFVWQQNAVELSSTNESLTVTEAGIYSCTASKIGCSDIVGTVTITSSLPNVSSPQTFCTAGSNVVEGNGSNLTWYDAAMSGNLLYTGVDYMVDIAANKSFFVVDQSSSLTTNVGPTAKNTAGWFNNDATEDPYQMIFDVTSKITLDFVTMFSEANQSFTIEIRKSDGSLLDSKNVALLTGENKVAVGIEIPVGYDYALSVVNVTNGLWVNDEWGTNTVSGYLDINHVKASWGTESWFAYFFDWEISASGACEAVEVAVVIDPLDVNCSITDINISNDRSGTAVYPNPFSDTFIVEIDKKSTYVISDVSGLVIESGSLLMDVNTDLGEGLAQGIYILSIDNEESSEQLKIYKQ